VAHSAVTTRSLFGPFAGLPSGALEVLADGLAGREKIRSPRDAKFRPKGFAQGPDGSLYLSDSVRGRIWRVISVGNQSTSP
jgi:glucose/arabinose dehydrogenase